MLWQKETKQINALYVDIFARCTANLDSSTVTKETILRPIHIKWDQISFQLRNEGNVLFSQKPIFFVDETIEKYNESLCYAEDGSLNISLAYANRSACFIRKGKFKESLVDIELAKNAGYPEHLMPKLEQRKLDCMRWIEKGMQSERFAAHLHYDPDEKFPCVANILNVEKDVNGIYSISAKEDIDVGKMIMVEKAYHTYLNRKYLKCDICLKNNANLMPCTKCTNAMFCSTECRENPLHQFECGLKHCNDRHKNAKILKVVRGILLAINTFSSPNELMDFVEQTIESGPYDLADDLIEEKSKYKMFLKQKLTGNFTDDEDLLITSFDTFKVILKMPKFATMFQSTKNQRFLMHLIGYHVHITQSNQFYYHSFLWTGGPLPTNIDEMTIYSQINLIRKYLHHSCAPNVVSYSANGRIIWISMRPIKKGEKLVETLIPITSLFQSTVDRQQELQQMGISCDCDRCNGKMIATEEQRLQILLDMEFRHILSFDLSTRHLGTKELPLTIDKCIAFLSKYRNFPWCDEIAKVMRILGEHLHQVIKRY